MKLDTWLLERIEKTCHAIQRQFGITCCRIAALLLIAYQAVLVAVIGLNIRTFHWAELVAFMAIILMWSHTALNWWDKGEQAAFRRVEQGFANPNKNGISPAIVRSFFLWFTVFLFVTVGYSRFGTHLNWILTLYFYVAACDPLPPCRGKVWERFEAFFATPAKASS